MSASTKLVKTYAKSLFQNLNKGDNNSTQDDSFSIAKITSSEQKNFLPDIFIVGEELLLLRATLISSEKLSIVFKDPTYSESQKLEILLSIFPGLTVTTKSFLKVLTERTHLSLLPLISEEFTTILLKIKNTTKVNLIAAS
jgi:F0F1-type ATP synthase delta subunit